MTAWLTLVGIGEDGLGGLSERARRAIGEAEAFFGAARHLAFIPDDGRARHPWPAPFDPLVEVMEGYRPRPVCVLASGDPFCFGVGAVLARRLAWSDVEVLSLIHI